jgi:hypothetical protein
VDKRIPSKFEMATSNKHSTTSVKPIALKKPPPGGFNSLQSLFAPIPPGRSTSLSRPISKALHMPIARETNKILHDLFAPSLSASASSSTLSSAKSIRSLAKKQIGPGVLDFMNMLLKPPASAKGSEVLQAQEPLPQYVAQFVESIRPSEEHPPQLCDDDDDDDCHDDDDDDDDAESDKSVDSDDTDGEDTLTTEEADDDDDDDESTYFVDGDYSVEVDYDDDNGSRSTGEAGKNDIRIAQQALQWTSYFQYGRYYRCGCRRSSCSKNVNMSSAYDLLHDMWCDYPSETQRRERMNVHLNRAWDCNAKEFRFKIDGVKVCESTFRAAIGLSYQTTMWKAQKKLVAAGGILLSRDACRKKDSFSKKFDTMRRWIQKFAERSCDRMPINDINDGILFVVPFLKVAEFAREYFLSQPGATGMCVCMYVCMYVCKYVCIV